MYNIYIAAPWVNMDKARKVREQLRELGHTVTSRWLDTGLELSSIPDNAVIGVAGARMCMDDIRDSDAFLLLTDDKVKGTGHHVETGVALALKLHMIQVGPITSVFQYLIEERYDTVEEVYAKLGAYR